MSDRYFLVPVTGWFPGWVPPARDGIYQIHDAVIGGEFFCLYRYGAWHHGSADLAKSWPGAPMARGSVAKWRGMIYPAIAAGSPPDAVGRVLGLDREAWIWRKHQ